MGDGGEKTLTPCQKKKDTSGPETRQLAAVARRKPAYRRLPLGKKAGGPRKDKQRSRAHSARFPGSGNRSHGEKCGKREKRRPGFCAPSRVFRKRGRGIACLRMLLFGVQSSECPGLRIGRCATACVVVPPVCAPCCASLYARARRRWGRHTRGGSKRSRSARDLFGGTCERGDLARRGGSGTTVSRSRARSAGLPELGRSVVVRRRSKCFAVAVPKKNWATPVLGRGRCYTRRCLAPSH